MDVKPRERVPANTITRLHRHSPHGWLLVGLIVLVSAVILALAGITFFLTQHLTVTSLRQNQTRAIYLAQAGVMKAFYDFRTGAGVTLREYQVDDPASLLPPGPNQNAFILSSGEARDFFLANMKPAFFPASATLCGVPRDRLTSWRLRNVLASTSPGVAIDKVAVNWEPAPAGETVIRLDLGGTKRWPRGAAACSLPGVGPEPPPDPPLTNAMDLVPDVPLGPRATLSGNVVWFSTTSFGAGGGLTTKRFIELKFQMSDGTIRVARFVNAIGGRDANFTIKSRGEPRQGQFPFLARRRLQAEYRICAAVAAPGDCNAELEERNRPGSLLSYQELKQQAP